MGYIEQNLMPDERVIYRASLHWNIFLTPVIIGFIGALLFIMAFAGDFILELRCAGMFLLALALMSGLGAIISYVTSEFAVTDKRILGKIGFIQRRSLELFLSKVEGIGVNQGIMGRLLGYGTIVVIGTGGTKQAFKNIVNPLEFRRQVHSQIH